MHQRLEKVGRYVLGVFFVALSLMHVVDFASATCPPPGGRISDALFAIALLWLGIRTALLPPTRRFNVISALVLTALLALMLGLALHNPNPPCDVDHRSTTWYPAAVAAVR